MKKIMLAVILIAAFVIPASAKNVDVVLKGGMLLSPYLNLNNNIFDVDLGFVVGGDFFVYPWERTGIGFGADHLFKTDIENTAQKISLTNIYFALKHKIFVFEDKEIDSIYLLGQAGFSTADIKFIEAKDLAGVYLGGGIGIESNWLIIEALYTLSNWMITDNDFGYTRGFIYSLKLNLGYKFSF